MLSGNYRQVELLAATQTSLFLPVSHSVIGGAVGGLLGCWMTNGQFKPLPQVIMEMTSDQQQKLCADVMSILGSIQWTDVAQLLALVMGNASLKQQVTAALLNYVHRELQAEVHYID